MTLFLTLIGAALIVLTLGDIFATVFHPTSRSGSLSRWVAHGLWRILHPGPRMTPTSLIYAGPVAMIVIIGMWTALLAVGGAFIYWPQLPENFSLVTGLDPADNSGFVDALYVSLVTAATLGYGDLTPTTSWLRILAPVQAFLGFAVVTSTISWILSTYPVLARRNSLAHEVALLDHARRETGVEILALDPSAAADILASLTSRLLEVRQDLAQFPITYYFRGSDPRAQLCAALITLDHLAARGARPDCPPEVRLQATVLGRAIEDVVRGIGERYLGQPDGPVPDLLDAFAADHYCQLDAPEDRDQNHTGSG